MRRRVTIGFLSIVCLLFFSGMVSFVELSHLSRDTGEILKANKRNIELAKEMLDAAYEQNVALIRLSVFGDNSYDSLCRSSMERLENTLLVAQSEALDKSFLDSLAFATTELRLLTDNYLAFGAHAAANPAAPDSVGRSWYDSEYEVLYGRLTAAIKNYMTSTQSSLAPRAEQMKKNAYRAVTPVLISLVVMIAIVLMLYYFMSVYCVNPIIRMNKGLGDYLSFRVPFAVKADCKDEMLELKEKIDYFKRILADENLMRQVIKEELLEIKAKYNTPRRTQLSAAAKDIDVEDLIAEEDMVITVTKAGYVKRLPVATYRQQKRGGKGMQGVSLKDNDFVEHLFIASTHSYMLFFSTRGKVYRLKVYEIPEASRQARGTAIVNLLPLEKGETISAIIATKDFPEDEYLMFGTAQGMVKKTSMKLYDRSRHDGLIAINLKEGDALISVQRVAEGEKVMMVSSAGKAIMWDESEVRAMGRDTMGVRGMNVPPIARVLGMEIAKPDTELLVITELGYGKRTPVEEYPSHHRGGQGVYTITMTEKKGQLSAMKIVDENDEIMIITEEGVVVRTPVSGVSQLGRSTQGVHVMNVSGKDKVSAVATSTTDESKASDEDSIDDEEPDDLSDDE